MKNILFLLLIVQLYAESASLAAKVIPSESNGYFVLSDGTFWKVSSFVIRWRSPLEWIAGDEIYVAENYKCTVADSSLGDEFGIYPKEGYLRVNESDASNEDTLRSHTHLFFNLQRDKILFATRIHPSDFMTQVYDHGYAKGYSKGYSNGYSAGVSAGRAAPR